MQERRLKLISGWIVGTLMLGGLMDMSAQTAPSLSLPGRLVSPPPTPRVIPLPPALTGLPYTLTEKTTTVQTLADGTKITHESVEHRMRDSRGRERTENGYIQDGQLKLTFISLSDPEAHTRTLLFLRDKTARVTSAPERPPRTAEQLQQLADARAKAEAARPPGVQPPQLSQMENLPPRNIAGVYAEGFRITKIIPQGKEGNDRDIKIISENWTSPELRIGMGFMSDDPRTGKTTTEITDLQRVEPDASLFEIPADYTVVEPAPVIRHPQ